MAATLGAAWETVSARQAAVRAQSASSHALGQPAIIPNSPFLGLTRAYEEAPQKEELTSDEQPVRAFFEWRVRQIEDNHFLTEALAEVVRRAEDTKADANCQAEFAHEPRAKCLLLQKVFVINTVECSLADASVPISLSTFCRQLRPELIQDACGTALGLQSPFASTRLRRNKKATRQWYQKALSLSFSLTLSLSLFLVLFTQGVSSCCTFDSATLTSDIHSMLEKMQRKENGSRLNPQASHAARTARVMLRSIKLTALRLPDARSKGAFSVLPAALLPSQF